LSYPTRFQSVTSGCGAPAAPAQWRYRPGVFGAPSVEIQMRAACNSSRVLRATRRAAAAKSSPSDA
jgi:hypothetical protein